LIVRFSQLVTEQPCIKEIDINPLLVSAEQIVALDARVVLHSRQVSDEQLPRTAIRPYPTRYASECVLKDNTRVLIRPIRAEDEPLMVAFHTGLSEQTVQLRYLYAIPLEQRVDHQRLIRNCFIDYDREMALVAERSTNEHEREIVGVSRLTKLHGVSAGRVSLVVSDRIQGLGLGHELLTRIIHVARNENLSTLYADTPAAAPRAQRLLEGAGFHFEPTADGTVLMGKLNLES
jgi:acetyltransferase